VKKYQGSICKIEPAGVVRFFE